MLAKVSPYKRGQKQPRPTPRHHNQGFATLPGNGTTPQIAACIPLPMFAMRQPVFMSSSAAAAPPIMAVRMSESTAVVKKRGLPPGEAAPDGVVFDKPQVVGKVTALDFLGLSSSDEKKFLGFNFAYYREAEIKHGRLAMLAAVAWPLQEILNPVLTDVLKVKDVLAASNGASPSLLNGGLFQLEVLPAVLLFAYGCAKLEQSDLAERSKLDLGWNEYANGFGYFGRTPGDFRFDPLNFYKPLDFNGKLSAQERELANGRIAMLAVASYVATEFVTKTPVVYVTPALFEPIIFQPWFRALMDASFGTAGMAPPGSM